MTGVFHLEYLVRLPRHREDKGRQGSKSWVRF
jgi:hypothetical protein